MRVLNNDVFFHFSFIIDYKIGTLIEIQRVKIKTKMKKIILSIALVIMFSQISKSQTSNNAAHILSVITVNNVDYPIASLPNIVIVSKRTFKNSEEQYRFNMLKKNTLIVYPYAIKAAKIYKEINDAIADTDSKRDKKKFIKSKQKELEQEFEIPLKNLTTTQGAILIKLISRYTGKNCYELISDYKNNMSAFFWNGASSLYGYSLKDNYDPRQDKDLEIIVRALEASYVASN